jgi:hypothetical protein
MISLVEGIYIIAMLCGIIWLIRRLTRFLRVSAARREAETRWAASFSEDEFQAFLETLRQKRDSQTSQQEETGQSDGPQSKTM